MYGEEDREMNINSSMNSGEEFTGQDGRGGAAPMSGDQQAQDGYAGFVDQQTQGGYAGSADQQMQSGYAGSADQQMQGGYAGPSGPQGQEPRSEMAGGVYQSYQSSYGYGNGPFYGDQTGGQYYQGQSDTDRMSGPAYQNQTNGQPQGAPAAGSGSQKPPKQKKKHGFFKKTAGIIAAALLFGLVAGGTMVGVNILADSMKKDEGTTQAAVTQPAAPASLSDEDLNKIVSQLKQDTNVGGASAVAMDVSAIVEKAMPSVVAINNTALYQSRNPWFGGTQTYEVPSAGSGIIVGQNETELLIATNDHVVEDATKLSVVFIDDTEIEVTVKGSDPESDLAIVAVNLNDIPAETLNQISIAELGDSDNLKIGQGVIAIGNALGYGQAVTVGYVSALNRQVTTDGTTRSLLQTDAAINPGNSGGALLNMQGQVIGINEAKYTDTDVEGMGFAIPISQAQDILDSLMVRRSGDKVDESEAGYLGIQGVTVSDTMIQQFDMPAGVYVYRILEGGAAAKTDLREKDVIISLDGQKVKTMAALQNLLQYYKKGETVEMVVKSLEYGEYVERTITITLGDQVAAE